ncbi:MAG: glycosyltransferase family 2 protein [Candidatus Deferrimicrobiaceae bacterium]
MANHDDYGPSDVKGLETGGMRTKGVIRESLAGKPLISVITVVYNSDKFLEEAIRSVFNQEYDNIEYLIIDGGSTDGTLDIIRKYQDRIDHWVSEPDNGIYDAMNKGIALASGDLIAFLNSDDRYEPGALEQVARAYVDQANQDVVIAGKWNLLFEDSDLVINASPSLRFHTGMPISHQAMVVPKKVYENHKGFNTAYRFAADLDLVVRLYVNKGRFLFIDAVIVSFRTFGASDKHYRDSVREASAIIRKNLPRRTYMAYKLLSNKYIALASLSKERKRIFGGKAIGRFEKAYFKLKAFYSRYWA